MSRYPRDQTSGLAPNSFTIRSDNRALYVAHGGYLSVVYNSQVYELAGRAGQRYDIMPEAWHNSEIVIARPLPGINSEVLMILSVRRAPSPVRSRSSTPERLASYSAQQPATNAAPQVHRTNPPSLSMEIAGQSRRPPTPMPGWRYFGRPGNGRRPGWYRTS